MTKKQRELAVCKTFVKLYNAKFGSDLLEPLPVPSKDEFPDCIARSASNPKDVYQLEVMVASPKEAENLGKTCWHEAYYEVSGEEFKIISRQIKQILKDLKRKKADKYSTEIKKALILLLEKASIAYNEEDISSMLSVIRKTKWQTKFKTLGFKQIWYATPQDIYKFYPI